MYKIGVIGDPDTVLGFLALGMEVFPAADGNAAHLALKRCMETGFALIYITEELYPHIAEIAEKVSGQLTPAIIPIPSSRGTTGIGMEKVRSAMVRAVGSDLLSGQDE